MRNMFYVLLFFIITGISSACNSGSKSIPKSIIISDDKINESHFSSEIVPHCIIDLASEHKENQCYVSSDEKVSDSMKVLHNRFMLNLKRLESVGGEYKKLPKNKHAIYLESSCTLGILRSCALDNILEKNKHSLPKDIILSLISGEANEYYENLSLIYPSDYDPRNYEQFHKAIILGSDIVSKQLYDFEETSEHETLEH